MSHDEIHQVVSILIIIAVYTCSVAAFMSWLCYRTAVKDREDGDRG